MNGIRRVVAAVGAVAALAGCTNGTGADKAGGPGEPVVLTLADGYGSLDYEPAVAHFVDRVAEVSGGRLRVEVTHEWGAYASDFELQIVRDVASGKADLAWVGTRVFDTLGVTTFQALTAPMLIDNYALQDAVLGSDIPGQMLPSLQKLGVTGLAMLADGMRKPIAVKKPLLGPGDWRGIRFGTLASRGQEAAITALGATPVEVLGPRRDEALAAGDLDAFELYLIGYQQNTLAPRAPYVTANVNLWPQVATLIADSDRLSGLTKDQRAWLSRAAGEAVERSRQLANQDAELAAEGCADGARFTNASAADLDALRRAFAPVYAELSKDAQTKTFIDRIEALKASTPREPPLAIPANCPKVVAPTAVVGATNRLDGVYRWTLTVDDARTYGTANDQQHLDDWYPTTFTMKLHRGICEMSQTADPGRESGTFEVNGNRITFHWGTDVPRTFTFTVGTNGTLTLEPVLPMNAGLQFVMTTHPWTKIG